MPKRPVRIANCAGFANDRSNSIREILDGGPVDVINGYYLAEVTLAGAAGRRSSGRPDGLSNLLISQLESCLDDILERGIKLVVNAGGFDPAGCAERIRQLATARPGKVAYVVGDDLLDRLDDLQRAGHDLRNLDTGEPLSSWGHPVSSANAYLGGWGIADALAGGADVVVCGRVTDASLTVGPAAWWHGWSTDDWDQLAGAVVAGHIIECGPHATGGNFSGFTRVANLVHPGFPIAEIDETGATVITKQPGTDGVVDRDTVTAQLLYEIQGLIYLNPDVAVDFSTVELRSDGEDRVLVHGATGGPPPSTTKVAITAITGWENSINLFLCGLDIEEKAALIEAQARDALAGSEVELVRVDRIGTAAVNPSSIDEATVLLRLLARSSNEKALQPSRFFRDVHSTVLGSIPGFHTDGLGYRNTRAAPLLEYWPAVVPVSELEHTVVHTDGARQAARAPAAYASGPIESRGRSSSEASSAGGSQWLGPDVETVTVPLGQLAHARAGDKGGNSNVGIWAADEAAWPWLRELLTEDRVRSLFPEVGTLRITRDELPHLRAVHFVFHGFLGDGASSNGRQDALGKTVGEFLRARHVQVPRVLL
jgi:hypothetical protein